MHSVRVGRNDPCPCGSGKKFKKCCLARHNGAAPGPVSPVRHASLSPGATTASRLRTGSQQTTDGIPEYVLVKNKGWTHRSELRPGDECQLKDGGWAIYRPDLMNGGSVYVKDKGWIPERELKPGDQYECDGVWVTFQPERIIGTTQEHPFYVQGKGWTPLAEIRPGDVIRTDNGWVQVTKIEDTGRYETVYNLRVADYHTYFVGGADWGFGVWAHNACHVNADPASSAQGERFRARAQELWNTLPDGRRYGATIAVTEVNGRQVVSLYANIGRGQRQFTQAQVNRFLRSVEDAGGTAIHTSGRVHAEQALHQAFGNAPAIGISNPNGPCSACGRYFQERGFFNLFWPDR